MSMKTLLRGIVLVLLACGVSAKAAGNPAGIDILVVKEPGGATAFKGKTGAAGSFATAPLDAGSYVVQFKSAALKGNQYSIAAVGGKRAVTAAGVPGEKFSGGGIAMKVEVAGGSRLTGQVAVGDTAAIDGVRSATTEARQRGGRDNTDSLRRMQDLGGQGAAKADGSVGRSTGTGQPGRP